MAAGLGFKTFTTGEVLTAADTNGYLMQGILVFATEAARNSAITSPQEGQFAFTKDTNSTWYYDGAAWVASGASGDVTGVTAGIGITVTDPTGPVPTVTNAMATAFTTSGDLIQATGSGTFARLGTGTSGQYLTTNGTTNSWVTATAAGANWSLLNAGGTSLSGTSTSITGISAKDKILVVIFGASTNTAGDGFNLTINSDVTTNYINAGTYASVGGTFSTNIFDSYAATGAANNYFGAMSSSVTSIVSGAMMITGANAAGFKSIQTMSGSRAAGGNSGASMFTQGMYLGTSTVSSVQFKSDGSIKL